MMSRNVEPTELFLEWTKASCFTVRPGEIISLLHNGEIITCKLLAAVDGKARISFLTSLPPIESGTAKKTEPTNNEIRATLPEFSIIDEFIRTLQ